MKIVFIGAGNLATNLCIALKNSGCSIIQIYSRTKKSAKILAKHTKSDFTNSVEDIKIDADIYIISVSDKAMVSTLNKLKFSPSLLVHTSGSTDMKILKKYTSNFGVIYPLQTLNKNKIINLKNVPICIEGCNKNIEEILEEIAKRISDNVQIYTSAQRAKIHLAAVFASNFTNHMYAIANGILQSEKINFAILKSLIEETKNNAFLIGPVAAQTGPANRNDKIIMNKQKEMLSENPLIEKIYSFVSKSIAESNIHKK